MALLPGWDGLWPCYSCCSTFWIPNLATFGDHCSGIVAQIPLWASLLILVCRYGLRPAWRRRPLWLRNFAEEEASELSEAESLETQDTKPTNWCISTIILLCISIAGIPASFLTSYTIGFGPLFLIPLLPCLISCIILAVDRPWSTPGAILALHGTLLAAQLALLLAVPELVRWPLNLLWVAEMTVPICALAIILTMPMRDPLLDDRHICRPFQTPTYNSRSPEDSFSLWHWMSITWMAPLISIAYRRQLHDEDVWLLPYQFQHSRLHRLFREVPGSVIVRLMKANAPDLILTSCLGILESVTSLLPIVFLKQLLAALELKHTNARAATVYAVLILCANLVRAQSGIFSLWLSRRCYERSRGEMITMIYEKTVRRKAFTFPGAARDDQEGRAMDAAAEPASMGKILNLMRNDVYEVAQRFWEFPSLFTKPLNFILSLVLLWRILGPASVLGILVVLLTQIMNIFVIRVLYRWELARRAITDLKLQVTSQFVEAIRHLRWYDWQDKWMADILTARQKELRYRVITGLLQRGIGVLNQLSAYYFPVAAFYAYTVIGKQPLTVDVAFPALGLFTTLETSLRELPDLVAVLMNAAVAMRRIEAFMAEPDKKDGHSEDNTRPPGDLRIEFNKASFAWPGHTAPVLSNVNFTCGPGLTVICGKVGTGKTALLQAILGELDQQSGSKYIPEEMMGYCAQTPWLQSMSIRENILFCDPYDERRYRQVLDACALLPDLAEFKAGDLSMVGENGVGLSGGQKARVGLARAVYSRARILLLDDPIAALDHQTAEEIMKKLFTTPDLMRGRMTVFVTHRLELITKFANQIVEVGDDGTVASTDSPELLSSHALQRVTSSEEGAGQMDELDGATDAIPDKFVEEEYRAHGGVMISVYWRYIKAGKLKWWACIIIGFSAMRVANIAYFYFLKMWGEAYGHAEQTPLLSTQTSTYGSGNFQTKISGPGWFDDIDLGLPSPDIDVMPWLFWFMMLSIIQLVTRAFSDVVLIVLTYTAGKKVFEDVIQRVSNATFRFFDITPIGRLMNRVTSDIGTIDGQIAVQVYTCAFLSISWLSAMVVIASATPLFLVLAVFMTAAFVLIFRRFLPASQSLRRLEMVSLSPLMSNFGTLLEGLTTVRAFRAQPYFEERIIVTTDAFQKMDHFYWSLQAWLMIRFDILSALSTFALTLTALGTGLSSGAVAFVLAAAASFVDTTHGLCRKYGELQMQFVSVERVIELLDLEQEQKGDRDPPAAWPTGNDDIVFTNVTVRYAPHLEPSLNNISMTIPAGSTVAVTGRTGSGKSTLALALLGTVLPDGQLDPDGVAGNIWIGNMDITNVNKHALRRRLSFVAQDPVLFPGTLRENLDPIGEHSDEDCATVLRRVMGDDSEFTIRSRVDGGGKNMSQGQRQLVGLGRAVLRRSPIVILDEATASIDFKTAFAIQQVLREELKHSTVICIAHRVEAVKDADFSVVLENGKVTYAGPTTK